jgi:ankyrin repeat protein
MATLRLQSSSLRRKPTSLRKVWVPLIFPRNSLIIHADEYGNRPLHYASKNDHIEKGADVSAKGVDSAHLPPPLIDHPQTIATGTRHCIMRRRMATLRLQSSSLRREPTSPRKVWIPLIFPRTSLIIHADKYGNTPLHYASENDHIEIAMLLVEKGADVSAKGMDSARLPPHLVDHPCR